MKNRKILFKITSLIFCLTWLVPALAEAFPNLERPNNANKPLDFDLSASNQIAVSPDDRFVVVDNNTAIAILDTATWALATTQPEDLEATTAGLDFRPNTSDLFVYESNGSIARIVVNDPLNNFLDVDVSGSVSTGSGPLVLDPDAIDNSLFILNRDTKMLFRYNIVNRMIEDSADLSAITTTPLLDLIYVSLPSNNDEIIVTTSESKIIIFDEDLNLLVPGGVTLSGTQTNCPTVAGNHILPAIAVHPTLTQAFVLNSTDNVIHVVDTNTNTEVVNANAPICLHQVGPGGIDQNINENILDIVIAPVTNPSANYGYVTGSFGVTVFNAVTPFDFIDIDPSTQEIDSIEMSRDPDQIAHSSVDDGYIYTANTDGTISVISANPFVTIASVNPTTINQASPSFTVTFQSDAVCEGCAYRVVLNGDINESGTLLLSSTFSAADAANTDLTTAAIDSNAFPEGTFIEGTNTVFVFADDADGDTGRDSATVTVDFPPTDIEVVSTNFGNMRGYLTLVRLTQEDITQYNVFVLPALDQANPTCPGGLDFSAVTSPTVTAPQPSGGNEIEIRIEGLENGVAYCVAVEAQDTAGNVSVARTVAPDPIIPEITVGITEKSGESGCSLHPHAKFSSSCLWIFAANLVLLYLLKRKYSRGTLKKTFTTILLCLVVTSSLAPKSYAEEATDQSWAAQFQGGFFLPTDDTVHEFLGTCCNVMYNFTFGRLWQSKYEVNIGVGFMLDGSAARGLSTDRVSGDSFSFDVVPISNSFVYRADFVENQLFVPYAGVGFDYMYFRENLEGNATQGMKFGYHAMAGVQILLEFFDEAADAMENEGINDVYLTLEGKWNQIDDFGGNGLQFNGFTMAAGLLFEF